MNRTVIALGMFDGVHLGHRALLERAASIAHENGDLAVAFTFSNHPREVFTGSADYLCTPRLKETLIGSLGIDGVDTVAFTKLFAAIPPEAFVQWLLKRYDGRVLAIVCGYDYRFGAGASGTGEQLKAFGKQYGFETEILDPVCYAGIPCSSTRVREALKNGDLVTANAMLDRPYAITGRVVHHKAIGRRIGFPTANVDPGQQLLPKDGVYASALLIGKTLYGAVTNIGCNPTVGGTMRTLETHLMDESMDLYGREATVLFLKRLREEQRFASIDALKERIAKDAADAKKVFEETEKSVYNTIKVW
jgi:riboflavin kinase/FMN adenylyltransferase